MTKMTTSCGTFKTNRCFKHELSWIAIHSFRQVYNSKAMILHGMFMAVEVRIEVKCDTDDDNSRVHT